MRTRSIAVMQLEHVLGAQTCPVRNATDYPLSVTDSGNSTSYLAPQGRQSVPEGMYTVRDARGLYASTFCEQKSIGLIYHRAGAWDVTRLAW